MPLSAEQKTWGGGVLEVVVVVLEKECLGFGSYI